MTADVNTVEEERISQESKQEEVEGLPNTEGSDEWEDFEQMQDAADGDEAPQEEADYAKQNEETFYEGAETLGLDHAEAELYYRKL